LNLLEDCTLERYTAESNINQFDCGNADLNDFLHNDALPYAEKLLGVTYIFTLDANPSECVCFFTVSNDGVRVEYIPNRARKNLEKKIPNVKTQRSYPAVKIGRLGVNKKYQSPDMRVGTQLMDFIKGWFIERNKTGCRFLLVDAYNIDKVLQYYTRNHFVFLLKEEDEQKKDAAGNPKPLATRLMFYDLING